MDETEELWGRVDAGVVRFRDASDPWDAYGRAPEVAGAARDRISSTQTAGSVYHLWACLTDLFDDHRLGRIPAAGAQFLLRQVAQDWLATPVTERDRLIDEWPLRD